MNTTTHSLIPVDHDPFFIGEIEQVIPTAETQLEIWLSCAIGGRDANCSYNESISLRLEGALDTLTLEQSLYDIIQRHEALRYTFSTSGRQIHVTENSQTKIRYEDISDKTDTDQKHYLVEYGNRDAGESFDLENGPLFRIALFKLANDCHVLRLTAHHIICDGWSFGILLEELVEIYQSKLDGRQPKLQAAIPMAQYSREMEAYAESEDYQRILHYWLDKFQVVPEPLTLPTDRPRPNERTYQSRRDDFFLDAALVQDIKRLGASQGLSFVNTLLISFEVYLSRLTGQSDIVIGLPTAGQAATGHFNLIGHCVNLLPIRSTVVSSTPFIEHLKRRKPQLLDDYDHQLFTYGSLLKSLKIKRDASRISLVPIVFNIDTGMDANVSFRNIKHTLTSNPRTFENFEIFLNLTGSRDSFILEWSYNTHLFNAETIKQMMVDFEDLLRTVVQSPSISIGTLKVTNQPSVGSKALTSRLLEKQDYPRDTPFFQLVTATAQRVPEKTAVRFGSLSLSYDELDERSNQFAHYLQQQGVVHGDVVGLAVDRSISLIVSLLGITKAGAAYLPLDPAYPSERIAYMLSDSNAKLLITNKQYIGTFSSEVLEIPIERFELERDELPRHALENQTKGDDLAYILYTSGSTGNPKGVEIEHHSLTNFLLSMQREPGITAEDRLLAVTTISFDIAGLELYLPLVSGAELVLADKESARDPRKLITLLDTERVTMMQATPATWRMLINAGWDSQKHLKVLCGGEAFPKDLAERLLKLSSEVWNMYGPTETTIWSSVKQLHANELDTITVGHPIANTSFYILDEQLAPVPQGDIGQLFIGGDGVARGYRGRADLTQDRFLPDLSDSSKRMYATGDLGKINTNGEIVCLGRMDHQVKIRGYRIELGEIEHQLAKHPSIKEAVVIAREDIPGDQRLAAYIIPAPVGEATEQTITWKNKWDTIYLQGIRSEADLDLENQNLDVAIVEQLGNQADDLKEQTAEWLNSSVNRIKRLAPKRILEVGSGAGQIMFQLVAEADQYIATDYAESAIEKLQEKIIASPDSLGHAQAHVAPADDFSCLGGMKPDLVLVHSVAQYFPDMDYLVKVISEAINHMDQGCIFLGDIQGKNTLPIHHTADQLHRTKDTASIADFKKIVANRLRLEDELTMDPAFFYRLPELLPQITGVDVQLRQGEFRNEITKYHYDVWLYVNGNQTQTAPVHTEKWQSVEQTKQLLSEYPGKTIAVTGIPNIRTTLDLAITAHLEELADADTVGTLKAHLEKSATHDGVDPNTLWELGSLNGYQAHVRWSTDGTDGTFEAVFIADSDQQLLPPPPTSVDKRAPIRDFIRIPGETTAVIDKKQLAEWKANLQRSLPDYMIPNDWVVLDRFPLTDNNKIDRKALPKPERPIADNENNQKITLSANEKLVANLWTQVLKINDIRPEDDFFELGGHSLLGVEVMTRIERETGIKLPFTAIFHHPTVGGLARVIDEQLGTNRASLKKATSSEIPVNSDVSSPSSSNDSFLLHLPILEPQQEIWISCQLGGEDSNKPYNMMLDLMFEGALDESALQRALNELVKRHEALRTTFSEDGESVLIHRHTEFNITKTDISSLTQIQQKQWLKDFEEKRTEHVFNLAEGPLFTATIIKTADTVNCLFLLMHHIICDGWSLDVIADELGHLYSAFKGGKHPDLGEAPKLSDYIQQRQSFYRSTTYSRIGDYWHKKYEEPFPVLILPTENPRLPTGTYRCKTEIFSIDSNISESFKQVAGSSTSINLLVLLEILFSKITGNPDIVIGVPVAGQLENAEYKNLIGHYVNTLPIRSRVNQDLSFTDYANLRVPEVIADYEHSQYTFSTLVQQISISGGRRDVPLLPVIFSYKAKDDKQYHFDGLSCKLITNELTKYDYFEISVEAIESDSGLELLWTYNVSLFNSISVTRLHGQFEALLNAVITDPSRPLKSISLPKEADLTKIRRWSDTNSANQKSEASHIPEEISDRPLSLIDRFESWVSRSPDQAAIYCNGDTVTFQQLHDYSSTLASQIVSLTINSPFVGVGARKTVEPIVGILSIIKAGKAYLPLDPTHPVERIKQVVEDSGITHIVCESSDSSFFEKFGLISLSVSDAIANGVVNGEQGLPGPGELVALLYTSGSTGIPKGACLTHNGMRNIIEHHLLTSIADAGVQLLSFAHLSFDTSFQDIFTSLTAGGTLHVIDDNIRLDTIQLLQYLERHSINMADLPYVTLQHLCETAEQLNRYPSALKEIMAGGELIKITPAIRNFFRRKPDCTLAIAYGPTECSIFVTDLRLRGGDADSWPSIPSIGRPVANTTIRLLDPEKREVPMGEIGEIHVGGISLAQGYLNREELTAERFINWTTPDGKQERLYCTGDLGLLLPSGEIEFHGRKDNQVKIRGNRVELGEIESCLAEHSDISQNVVVMREDVPGIKRLVAYVIATDGASNDVSALRTHLGKKLPNYMIPDIFVWVESFSRTTSGKVDLRALPVPEGKRVGIDESYQAPTTEQEKFIASLWSSLLSIDQVGIDDNFFELGGNSMLAVRFMLAVQKEKSIRLPLMTTLFRTPTIRELAAYLDDYLTETSIIPEKENQESRDLSVPLVIKEDADGISWIPTIDPQKEIWLACQLGGKGASLGYNIPITVEINGQFDRVVLEESLQHIVSRHEALRTIFSEDGEQLRILPEIKIPIIDFDLSAYKTDLQKAKIEEIFEQLSNEALDLATGPLFRIAVLKLSEDSYLIHIILHHIICDGWSTTLITNDLLTIYASVLKGETPNLPSSPKLSSYINDTFKFYNSPEYQKIEDYWLSKFKVNAPKLNLPIDGDRPQTRSYQSERIYLHIDAPIFQKYKASINDSDRSTSIGMLTALEVFLYHLTGENNLIIGLPVAGQLISEDYWNLVAHCVNMLPIVSSVDGEVSYKEYFKKRQSEIYQDYEHQRFTFGTLFRKLNFQRDSNKAALIPLVFNFITDEDDSTIADLNYRLIDSKSTYDNFEIVLNAFPQTDGSLKLSWQFNTSLFSTELITEFHNKLTALIASIALDTEKKINELSMYAAGESTNMAENLAVELGINSNEHVSINEMIDQAMANFSSHAAIEFGDLSWSYAELKDKSNLIANLLIKRGVLPGDHVGISLDRSPDLIAIIIAIIRVGAAYVPIDLTYPKDRINAIIENATPKLLFIHSASKAQYDSHNNIIAVEELPAELTGLSTSFTPVRSIKDPIIYVLHTSGSTGKPKGVCLGQGALINLLQWQEENSVATVSSKTLQFSPITFDVSFQEIFSTLITGGTLSLIPEELRFDPYKLLKHINDQAINRIFLPFVALQALAETASSFNIYPESLKEVMTAGEQLKCTPQLISFFSNTPSCTLYNQYGPTETHVVTQLILSGSPETWALLPSIGSAIKHTKVFLLNDQLREVGKGNIGEICIAGRALAHGYLNSPELTSTKFVGWRTPFGSNIRIYRTGDLGRQLPNGDLEFLGRKDNQVKIRGYRVELGEIEALLNRDSAVKQAAVKMHEDKGGNKRIIAFIIPTKHDKAQDKELTINPADINRWKAALQDSLPDYMIPSAFIALRQFPLTNSGKVDLKSLPTIEQLSPHETDTYVAPRNNIEKLIAKIWEKTIGIEKPSVTSNFFDIGGHSLIAVKIMLAIERETGKHLPLATLFENPTIQKLALLLNDDKEVNWKSLVAIKPQGSKPPLYLVHAAGMNVLVFQTLSKYLNTDLPIYGLQARGLNDVRDSHQTVEEMASAYVSEIIEHNPTGPYFIAGYSSGGTIAYEMRRQFQKLGKEVAFVGMFDSFVHKRLDDRTWNKNGPIKMAFLNAVYAVMLLFRHPKAYLKDKYFYLRGVIISKTARLNLPYPALAHTPEHIQELQRRLEKALDEYEIMPTDQITYLFRANAQMGYYPYFSTNGWAPYLGTSIHVVNIPGDHMGLFKEPSVKVMARQLQRILDELHARGHEQHKPAANDENRSGNRPSSNIVHNVK